MTFADLEVLDNSKIALICSIEKNKSHSNIGGKPIKWIRFSTFEYNSNSIELSTSDWTAVAFVPRRKIMFMGFGVMGHRLNKDITYIC